MQGGLEELLDLAAVRPTEVGGKSKANAENLPNSTSCMLQLILPRCMYV